MADSASPPNPARRLARRFYLREPERVAAELIGCMLVRHTSLGWIGGRIVETEAYLATDDPASHSRSGLTNRCRSMFSQGGTLYVYTIHAKFCLNVVTQPTGIGSAVLIRALQPLWGLVQMQVHRGIDDERQLARGPANLCRALGVTIAQDGLDLVTSDELMILKADWRASKTPAVALETFELGVGPRIGISRAVDLPLRFFVRGSRYVSGPARLRN